MGAKAFAIALAGASLAGCARSSTIPLAQDTFQVTTTAAPMCGAHDAQQVAFKQAAIETIRRGYDRFLIAGGQSASRVIGHTPIYIESTGYGGAIAHGGAPMVSHGQGLIVKVFRDGDPAGANALSARQTLGPDWQEVANKGIVTCL